MTKTTTHRPPLTRAERRAARRIEAVLTGFTAAERAAWRRWTFAEWLRREREQAVDAVMRRANRRAGRLAR